MNGLETKTPALLTRVSTRPKRSIAWLMIWSAVACSEMSPSTVRTSGSFDGLMLSEFATTAQPRCRYPSTRPAPIPCEPPVTIATFCPVPLTASPFSCVRAHVRPGSAREVLRALGGEMALQQAGGLADLDEVSVRVTQVAADLRSAVDRRRHELRPLRLLLLVAGLDVSDPQVHEDRGGVTRLVVDYRDARLVGGRRPAGIHDDPRVGQPDRAGVLFQDDGAAKDARVEVPRSRDLADGDEQRHQDALGGRREATEIVAGRGFCHRCSIPGGTRAFRPDSRRPPSCERARLGPAAKRRRRASTHRRPSPGFCRRWPARRCKTPGRTPWTSS